jgi:hypothetical protein
MATAGASPYRPHCCARPLRAATWSLAFVYLPKLTRRGQVGGAGSGTTAGTAEVSSAGIPDASPVCR